MIGGITPHSSPCRLGGRGNKEVEVSLQAKPQFSKEDLNKYPKVSKSVKEPNKHSLDK